MPAESTITSCGCSCSVTVVLGVDHPRGGALRAWQRLERVVPLRGGAQIQAAQVFRLTPPRHLLLLGLDRAGPIRGAGVL